MKIWKWSDYSRGIVRKDSCSILDILEYRVRSFLDWSSKEIAAKIVGIVEVVEEEDVVRAQKMW